MLYSAFLRGVIKFNCSKDFCDVLSCWIDNWVYGGIEMVKMSCGCSEVLYILLREDML